MYAYYAIGGAKGLEKGGDSRGDRVRGEPLCLFSCLRGDIPDKLPILGSVCESTTGECKTLLL